jgi:hypothetical protein
LEWSTDNGISRLGAASLAIGNGTAGDTTGILTLEGIHCNLGSTLGLQYDPNFVSGLVLGSAAPIKFSSSTPISAGVDTGISRLNPASLAIGNGTAGDFSGSLKLKSVLITDTAANTDLTVQNTTTATSSTTNASPLQEFAANYWTGSASAADTWTIGSSLAAGTNGISQLTFSHTGSSGTPQLIFPSGTFSVPSLSFAGASGTGMFMTSDGALAFAVSQYIGLAINGGAVGPQVSASGGYFWNSISGQTGADPSTGSRDTGISRISAGILGVGTGAVGSIAGNIQCSSIALNGAVASPTAGIYYSGTNAGITQAAEAVGTIATTGGIVTTFTAVSDERLKISQEYKGGLDEILNIYPIRYRWNEIGQKYSGQSTERDFIGFSAQNVQKSIPEAVWVSKDDYLGFEDRPVIAALVNAVKELKAEIEVLKARK